MTAKELIDLLKDIPPETTVFGWQDGYVFPIETVDQWDEEFGIVYLNLAKDSTDAD